MTQYTQIVNGKEYVLIQDIITYKTSSNYQREINDWGAIIVGIEVERHWLFVPFMKLTILIPVDKVFEYQKR